MHSVAGFFRQVTKDLLPYCNDLVKMTERIQYPLGLAIIIQGGDVREAG